MTELKKLRWCGWDAFSQNLKARDEWRTQAGLLASGRIRYTIEVDKGYWRVFQEGDHGSYAHGYVEGGDTEAAKAAIEKWRNDHLEMPLMKVAESFESTMTREEAFSVSDNCGIPSFAYFELTWEDDENFIERDRISLSVAPDWCGDSKALRRLAEVVLFWADELDRMEGKNDQ